MHKYKVGQTIYLSEHLIARHPHMREVPGSIIGLNGNQSYTVRFPKAVCGLFQFTAIENELCVPGCKPWAQNEWIIPEAGHLAQQQVIGRITRATDTEKAKLLEIVYEPGKYDMHELTDHELRQYHVQGRQAGKTAKMMDMLEQKFGIEAKDAFKEASKQFEVTKKNIYIVHADRMEAEADICRLKFRFLRTAFRSTGFNGIVAIDFPISAVRNVRGRWEIDRDVWDEVAAPKFKQIETDHPDFYYKDIQRAVRDAGPRKPLFIKTEDL